MSNWKLEYEIQQDGTITYGSVSALLSKVKKGFSIKVMRFPKKKQPMILPCNEVKYIENSLDLDKSGITCSFVEQFSNSMNSKKASSYIFESDIYHYFMLLDSDGYVDISKWKYGEHTTIGGFNERHHLKWFVEDSVKWKIEYEILRDGVVTYGNIQSLLKKIENGTDVKVVFFGSETQPTIIECEDILLYGSSNVACEYTHNMALMLNSQRPHSYVFQKDIYHYYMLINSDGYVDESRWSYGEHVDKGHTNNRYHLKWLVKEDDVCNSAQNFHLCKVGQADKIVIEKNAQIDLKSILGTEFSKCKSIILGFTPVNNNQALEDTIDLTSFGCISKIAFKTLKNVGRTSTINGQENYKVSAIRIEGQESYVACIYNFDADNFKSANILLEDVVVLSGECPIIQWHDEL